MFHAGVLMSLNYYRLQRTDRSLLPSTLFPSTLFPSAFGPICQELRLTFVCQRMIEQLVDHFKRHRRNISSHSGCFNDVDWMTQAGGENFCLPAVVLIDLNDLLEQH